MSVKYYTLWVISQIDGFHKSAVRESLAPLLYGDACIIGQAVADRRGVEVEMCEAQTGETVRVLSPSKKTKLQVAIDALNDIACWDEGPEVNGSFDEPGSASRARKALSQIKELSK